MKEVMMGLGQLWQRQRYEFTNGSRIICKTPGYLVYAHLGNESSTARKATLYDGENSNEQKLTVLTAPGEGNDQYNPALPTPLQRGLYAELESDSLQLTVVVITRKE